MHKASAQFIFVLFLLTTPVLSHAQACAIGCGHWVSRRLIPSAQSRGRGGSAGPSRCMQQTLIGLFINRYEFGRLL